MNIIAYTAITNGKDNPRNDITVFSEYNKFVSPVMNAKIYKVLPHKFLDCDVSIWLDGNIYLKVPKEKLINEWLKDADMVIFNHNHSKRLTYEVKWIKYALKNRSNKRELLKEVNEQVAFYLNHGIPNRMKMALGRVIIRRHTPLINQFNEAWWAEICRWSQRDQLSLPVIISQFPNLKVNYLDGRIENNPYLHYQDHLHFNT